MDCIFNRLLAIRRSKLFAGNYGRGSSRLSGLCRQSNEPYSSFANSGTWIQWKQRHVSV
jgi:hypothetical protein